MSLSRGLLAMLLLLFGTGLAGCASAQAEATAVPIATKTTAPDIRGTVQQWEFVNGEGSMLVEGEMADGSSMAAQVRVTGQTQIVRQSGGTLEAGQITQLASGQTVEVRFDGPVMESFPIQATAKEVVIVE